MSNYYCLIAGLPELHLDDQKLPFTTASFREEVYDQLTCADQRVVDLFFLRYDNANLLHFLKDKEAVLDPRGKMSAEDLDAMVKQAKDGDDIEGAIAPYFQVFLQQYFQEKAGDEAVLIEDVLSTLYFDYALRSCNHFTKRLFEFNLNLNNLLIASQGRKYGFDTENFILGDNVVAKALRTSSARDWGLSAEIDYLESVQRIAEEKDIEQKERKIDQLKWEWLEEQTFFHYFSVERIIAFMLRLEILERWMLLDKEKGEANLRQMIARLKEEVSLPVE